MPSSSDAETELGDDSPLSPCVWTHPQQDAESAPARSRRDAALQPQRAELRLSPASQLNVLSQISELAAVQSRQFTAAAAASRPSQRAHVWASTRSREKRKPDDRPAAPSKPKKPKEKKHKQPARSQTERLAADMADWETCSEGDLFEGDADELDEWSYDDISDSDFEA